MSSTIQNINQLSTETETRLPTWQDIEKLIIDILRAGFMAYYKNHLDELRKSEDQEQYIHQEILIGVIFRKLFGP
ncbi:hypothetical protein Glove_8g111 [Diversispora epigaea]|uniref:Uncharacterized protein n=1 Tax=Diversispora epigaea TaxID=1348612 RepID=A0A397K033_9GLOM|nr:hypothetical protein Glove_8g111 [Diversispora epigaea]